METNEEVKSPLNQQESYAVSSTSSSIAENATSNSPINKANADANAVSGKTYKKIKYRHAARKRSQCQ